MRLNNLEKTIDINSWGVHKYGAKLVIDLTPSIDPSLPLILDVETDEKDNFVGIGYTQDGQTVYYSDDLGTVGRHFNNYLNQKGVGLTGHNLKFDAKLLLKWGVSLTSESLRDDTQLMSYVINSTKDTHALKELGKSLGFIWPTYKDIVGSGRKKLTLDKQPIELVAAYCGMDVFVTYQLYHSLKRKMDAFASRIYNQIEMPLMRILFEMELEGVLIDVDKVTIQDTQFKTLLGNLEDQMFHLAKQKFNPNSNLQTANILESRGIILPRTEKGNKKVDKFVLEQYKEDEFVKLLLQFNKIEKLYSTYTQGILKLDTLPKVYTTYNQVTSNRSVNDTEKGISTGRLSSNSPNLQQIPTRTDEGKTLREIFIPKREYILIDADYSQVEYRLLAHFTKEPLLLEAFKNGKDVHEETGKALGCDRDTGKTLNFASIYGAQAKKIAKTAKCSIDEAEAFLTRYWKILPRVTSWINRIKYEARQKKGIFTLQKRWIPIPEITSQNPYERMHWERVAVNYTIQGSAAEIMKLAMIECRKKGLLPLLTVHDELLFECPVDMKDVYTHVIKQTMESVVKIDVPLVVDIGTGKNWREAKGE
jgi:DNA polymerase-1